jgi:prolyl 4-hydroxylase
MNKTKIITLCVFLLLVAIAVYFSCKNRDDSRKMTTCKEDKYIKNCAKQMLHVLTSEPENMSKDIVKDSNPVMIIYDDFLSDYEVDFLIKNYKSKTTPSTVVSNNNGYSLSLETRKSFSHYLEKSENDVVRAIEERASDISGFPKSFIEPVQFLKYEKGGYFRPHRDYFSEDYTNNEYQRYATIFVYLNDDFEGGNTLFPEIGVEVIPKRGRAVLWFNVKENGEVNPLTLHTGTEVTDGYKCGLNIWIRNKKFSM